ncbi:MAG: hydroxymethylbilane synthase [Spirochaetes bacterium]|nr:hydroxymethylbilane synthase [Spirochaetota bacterium]
MATIRIGTRGSKLALVQSDHVRDVLTRSHPEHDFELVTIKTTGDKILDAPLSKIGDKGLFTKEIEKELIDGAIDLAVHSMKDMPTALPEGLRIGAVTKRLDPCDVFISRDGKKLRDLGDSDTVATGSLRRKAQLLAFNPGLHIVDIRGNVQSRLKKMRENPALSGIILAHAGLARLNMTDIISETIPEDMIISAVGQAALAIEIRSGDRRAEEIITSLNDPESEMAIGCERAFLSALGGGCQVPIAGLARLAGNELVLRGMVASLDGREIYQGTLSGSASDHDEIGRSLARKLLDEGARKILEQIYGRPL